MTAAKNIGHPNCNIHHAADAIEVIKQTRRSILEEAARICEAQIQVFLSPEYATNQPLSSIAERSACKACARAIRAAGAPEDRQDITIVKGSRVCLSAAARDAGFSIGRGHGPVGTVVGFSADGRDPAVIWDGGRSRNSYHVQYLTLAS